MSGTKPVMASNISQMWHKNNWGKTKAIVLSVVAFGIFAAMGAGIYEGVLHSVFSSGSLNSSLLGTGSALLLLGCIGGAYVARHWIKERPWSRMALFIIIVAGAQVGCAALGMNYGDYATQWLGALSGAGVPMATLAGGTLMYYLGRSSGEPLPPKKEEKQQVKSASLGDDITAPDVLPAPPRPRARPIIPPRPAVPPRLQQQVRVAGATPTSLPVLDEVGGAATAVVSPAAPEASRDASAPVETPFDGADRLMDDEDGVSADANAAAVAPRPGTPTARSDDGASEASSVADPADAGTQDDEEEFTVHDENSVDEGLGTNIIITIPRPTNAAVVAAVDGT